MWNWLHTCSFYSEIIICCIWKNEMGKKYSVKDVTSDPLKPVVSSATECASYLKPPFKWLVLDSKN